MREMTELQLYRQLSFFDYIFDFKKAMKKSGKNMSQVHNVTLKKSYDKLQQVVAKFLKMNGYSVINLGEVFRNLYVKAG